MHEFLKKLSEKLGKTFSEEKAADEIVALIGEKEARISELEDEVKALEPLAEDGKAWRKDLVDQYVTLRTKLEEIPPDDESRQKQAKEIAQGFPIDFLKSEVEVLQKRVYEKYPAESQVKGNDPEKDRDQSKDWRKNNPLNPNKKRKED